MSWATSHIRRLQAGETVTFRPRGHSMAGIVNDGALVTVVPAGSTTVKVGDVLLCRVSGNSYLHLAKAVDGQGRVQIGNNRGGINGWTKAIYGRCTEVDGVPL